MKLLTLISALLLLAVTPVQAETTVFELDGNDLRIPVSSSGAIAFRECQTCNFQRHRIAGDANYVVNGTAMSLEQLRQALATASDKSRAMITLFYDTDSQRVTRITARIR